MQASENDLRNLLELQEVDIAGINAQKKLDTLWSDRDKWNQMSLLNIAGAGSFAADRAINDYARDIWNAKAVK